jgi:hypothetical protein
MQAQSNISDISAQGLKRAFSSRTRIVVIAIWLVLLAVGFGMLMVYSQTPGQSGQAPRQWPSQSSLGREAGVARLLMFAHPKCPCTRASLEELARLVAQTPGLTRVDVLFFKPKGESDAWAQTGSWRSAESIPGVRVHADEAGAEADLFHARTSGEVMLYSAEGRLLFQGGITFARGHAGDNDGRDAIVAQLRQQETFLAQTPVYGCSLGSKCERQK